MVVGNATVVLAQQHKQRLRKREEEARKEPEVAGDKTDEEEEVTDADKEVNTDGAEIAGGEPIQFNSICICTSCQSQAP